MQRLRSIFSDTFHVFKSDKYSVPDLLFFYSLFITFTITLLSVPTNIILGLHPVVSYIAGGFSLIVAFLFWLSYYKGKMKTAKGSFIVLLILSFNGLWIFTEGSAGSTFTILQAMLTIVIFYESPKTITYIVPFVFINILALFAIEIFAPHWIVKYDSVEQRTLDILVVTVFFFVLMLPVLIHAKKSIERQRNEAINSEAIKTSFFLNLSHEIRTPMNAILGFSELLEDPDLDLDQRQQYLTIINQNGRSLLNLLNNVISFSKLESTTGTVVFSHTSANELVQQVYYSLQQMVDKQKPIDFRMNCPDENADITTDVLKAYQILLNITFNAIKFTEKGFVEIGFAHTPNTVTFYVKDTGCGISTEDQLSIFDRFTQGGQTVKASNLHGAGLGLAICKRLSVLIGAHITFDSREGHGSTFYVKIPQDPARA